MPDTSRSNLYLGLICTAFAAVVLFVWIPLDTDSGIVEKMRGRFNIGDALAPTVAAVFILVGGLLLVISERREEMQATLTLTHLSFIAKLLGVTVLSLLAMRFAGPAFAELANLFRAEPVEYRLLRATPGWMHIGFILGGTGLVTGLIAIVERGFSRRGVMIAALAVAVLILVFDLPFEDLLLPPNGDV